MKIKTITTGFLIALLVLLIGNVSWANDWNSCQQKNQQKRIVNGVRSGKITNNEYRRLNNQQYRIQNTLKSAKADGRICPWEKQKIKGMQNKASRQINRSWNNNRTCYNDRPVYESRYPKRIEKRYSYYQGQDCRNRNVRTERNHSCYNCQTRPSNSCYSMSGMFSAPGFAMSLFASDVWH